VHAAFGVRAGSRALESDLAYTRYLGQGWYRYGWGRHRVQVTGIAGGITGNAPLFERFSLGDSVTLRGWDKYEIAPAGGDRVVHSSIEYGFRGLSVFLDVGSVWDDGTEREIRVSTGLGFHAGPAFLTIGIPLNTDNLRAVVSLGLRLSSRIGVQR
jgi:outer membrane protein assembly factor BamA